MTIVPQQARPADRLGTATPRCGRAVAAAALMCALVGCARIPVEVADEFQPDEDPARNHYLKEDIQEPATPDAPVDPRR